MSGYDDGVAVGVSTNAAQSWRATIWQDGRARKLELSPQRLFYATSSFRINSAGQILARADDIDFIEAFFVEPTAPFLWFSPWLGH